MFRVQTTAPVSFSTSRVQGISGKTSVTGVSPNLPAVFATQWKEGDDAVLRDLGTTGAVITDDRSVSAELLYYMRGEATPVLAWRLASEKPQDHYELTRPYFASPREPVLLVSVRATAEDVTRHFTAVTALGANELPAGMAKRRVALFMLSGYAPQAPQPRTKGKKP